MSQPRILIVDDEKNIRLTLTRALDSLGAELHAAMNGEDALTMIEDQTFALVLLDLKMPGMGGMEVMRRLREKRPDIKVIVITAHGTIDAAVEAMKLGTTDFIEKPFTPAEIRELVQRVLSRGQDPAADEEDYRRHLAQAREGLKEGHLEAAQEHARQAITVIPGKPEAFNLAGAIHELKGDKPTAQKHYRAALSLDPTYEPAAANLRRSTQLNPSGRIDY